MAAGTFFVGIGFIVGVCLYGQSVAAPVTWFTHLPAQEDHFFQKHTANRKDAISILEFANISEEYQESQKSVKLTQQRQAMDDVKSPTVQHS